jgi:hypothetical protein
MYSGGGGGVVIESLSLVEMVIGSIIFEIKIGVVNREDCLPSFHFFYDYACHVIDNV